MSDLQQWAEGLIGAVIADKYEITHLLGIGGAGGVFLARHTVLGSDFALKLIVPNPHAGSKDEQQKRFVREAATSLNLVHPRIVQVREFGIDKGRDVMYMAMDYVQGQSLAEVLDRAGAVKKQGAPLIPFPRALAIVRKLLDALAVAHAAGVVHRDLKPGNIILVGSGEDEDVRILDFGFAKICETSAEQKVASRQTQALMERITLTGSVLGTPQYMAPEQARGRDVDHRADLYALGVMLYEMLTGALPHTGSNFNRMLFSRATEPPLPLEKARPDVEYPDSVRVIIDYALSSDPETRFADAAQFAEMVDEALGEMEGGDVSWPAGMTQVMRPAAYTTGPPSGSVVDAAAVAAAVATAVTKAIASSGRYSLPEDVATVLEQRGIVSGRVSALVIGRRRRLMRIVVGVGVLLAAALVAAVALVPRGDGYARHMDDGARELANRNWGGAIAACEAALAARPGDAAANKGIRDARRGELVALLEASWGKVDTAHLKETLAGGKDVLDRETYELFLERVATLEDIPRIDDMLRRRRYANALEAVNARLDAGPHPERVKTKLDSQHLAARGALQRAQQLLSIARSLADQDDVAKIREGIATLKEFVELFPEHAELADAKNLMSEMERSLAGRQAKLAYIHIDSPREGLACFVDDVQVGSTNCRIARADVAVGSHTVRLVDDEGFSSTYTLVVTDEGQSRRIFDHDSAVAAERAAFARVTSARGGEPAVVRAACAAYLEAFPSGAKREAARTLLERTDAAIEADGRAKAEAEAYDAILALRGDGSAKPERRIEAAQQFVDAYPDSERRTAVVAWLTEWREEQRISSEEAASRARAIASLTDPAVDADERMAIVTGHIARFSADRFKESNRDIARRLVARPLALKGRLALSRPAGRGLALVVTAEPATAALCDLRTGVLTAQTPLGRHEVFAASASLRGDEAFLGTRAGAVLRWSPGRGALLEVHSFASPVRQLVALGGGKVIASDSTRNSATLLTTSAGGVTSARRLRTLGGVITASAASAERNVIALADNAGEIALYRVGDNGSLTPGWRTSVGGPVVALSMSPLGEALAASYAGRDLARTSVFVMSDGVGKRIADHAVGSGWLQVLAPDGRALVGGVVVGPKVGDRHLPLQVGAACSVDASGTLLVGARSDGEAMVCYLPELLKQVARARGSDG